MWPELIFLNFLWIIWALNLLDVLLTERGIRMYGLHEENLFLSWLIHDLGWRWFAVLKVAAVGWLHIYLFTIFLDVKPFRPFAWFAAFLAFILVTAACIWNVRLVSSCQRQSKP